jgi:hypothetical protein
MNIDVEMDRVIVEGQTILRPAAIPRSRWIAFWETVQNWQKGSLYCERCGDDVLSRH